MAMLGNCTVANHKPKADDPFYFQCLQFAIEDTAIGAVNALIETYYTFSIATCRLLQIDNRTDYRLLTCNPLPTVQ